MVTIRPFSCFDLLNYGNINLDMYTETYSVNFYLHYLSKWPEYIRVHESPILTCFEKDLSRVRENTTCSKLSETESGKTLKNVNNFTGCPTGQRLIGYMIAKSEGRGTDWHSHVTALTVAPEYRRLGLATKLMLELERTSERKRCYFVDLFVRASNKLGYEIYTKLDYIIYRRVLNYYWGTEVDEDAFDMRKALSTDVEKKSIIPMTRPIYPSELEHP